MVTEPLSRHHDRASFGCGQESLDTYLKQYARQNDEKGLSRTFVAVEDVGQAAILGYYTLSNGSVSFEHLPAERLPRYPIPTVLLARLAVDKSQQGRGLGKILLMDALRRAARISQEAGVFAVEVVALNEEARRFYLKYGFHALEDDRLHLYLTLKAIRELGL